MGISRDEKLSDLRRPSYIPYCGPCDCVMKAYSAAGVLSYYKCPGCGQTVSVPRVVIPLKVIAAPVCYP